MPELYRKAALERLSSPEQLDKTITVSSPVSWLALLGVTIAIATVITWSFLGVLPTSISAQGIVVNTENSQMGQLAESYVPYFYATQIRPGMRASVKSADGSSRISAEVISVQIDGIEFSDMELVIRGRDIPVVVTLRLIDGTLPKRTIITANIIVEEVTPISRLFAGF